MTATPRPVSPLATPPEETPGHGLLLGRKVVVTAAAVVAVEVMRPRSGAMI